MARPGPSCSIAAAPSVLPPVRASHLPARPALRPIPPQELTDGAPAPAEAAAPAAATAVAAEELLLPEDQLDDNLKDFLAEYDDERDEEDFEEMEMGDFDSPAVDY